MQVVALLILTTFVVVLVLYGVAVLLAALVGMLLLTSIRERPPLPGLLLRSDTSLLAAT
jgi:hypothetical protein